MLAQDSGNSEWLSTITRGSKKNSVGGPTINSTENALPPYTSSSHDTQRRQLRPLIHSAVALRLPKQREVARGPINDQG